MILDGGILPPLTTQFPVTAIQPSHRQGLSPDRNHDRPHGLIRPKHQHAPDVAPSQPSAGPAAPSANTAFLTLPSNAPMFPYIDSVVRHYIRDHGDAALLRKIDEPQAQFEDQASESGK